MLPRPSIIGAFFLRTLLWLTIFLVLWYWQRESQTAAVSWLAGKMMKFSFPRWVEAVEHEDGIAILLTEITAFAEGGIGTLAPEVRVLSYCYGLPLYAALLMGSQAQAVWWKLPAGAVVILFFQSWGVSFNWLMTIAVQLASLTTAITGFSELQRNLFALAYQLGYLLFPSLVPLLLWAVLERRFIATIALEGAMSAVLEQQEPS